MQDNKMQGRARIIAHLRAKSRARAAANRFKRRFRARKKSDALDECAQSFKRARALALAITARTAARARSPPTGRRSLLIGRDDDDDGLPIRARLDRPQSAAVANPRSRAASRSSLLGDGRGGDSDDDDDDRGGLHPTSPRCTGHLRSQSRARSRAHLLAESSARASQRTSEKRRQRPPAVACVVGLFNLPPLAVYYRRLCQVLFLFGDTFERRSSSSRRSSSPPRLI